MLADDATVGDFDFAGRGDDENGGLPGRDQPVDRTPGDDEVVPLFVTQRPEIGFDLALPRVHEQDLVGVGVAEEVRHRLLDDDEQQRDIVVAEERDAPGEVVAALQTLEITSDIGARAQLAFDVAPADGRLSPVEVARTAEETAPGVLLFARAIRDVDVRLKRDSAFDVVHFFLRFRPSFCKSDGGMYTAQHVIVENRSSVVAHTSRPPPRCKMQDPPPGRLAGQSGTPGRIGASTSQYSVA